ncbi:MAPK15 family protein [Megaselia abdita]
MSTKTKSQDKHKMSEIDEQILRYFDIKRRLGKGAYGIVWKAIDKKTNNIVAVKKIFDAFRNETDAQRTFREIMFLRAFRSHPNVIQLHNIYKASNNLDIYLSFEYMESDLHNVIKKGTILKDVHKRYVMYQLFNAISYIHSGNVIHRDLKPSNILLNSKCKCKIADFGLARSVSSKPTGDSNTSLDPCEPILTDYVATRWYRAPEILVASKRYTKGIDMWSLGCILGEMIRGKPIFPGSSTVNQIERIVTALPKIKEREINSLGAGFGSALLNQQALGAHATMEDLLYGSPDDAKHLVKSLLVLDPVKRLTATDALNHVYIEKFRNSQQEFQLNCDVLPPFRDDVQLSVPEYRSKLYELVQTSLSTPPCPLRLERRPSLTTRKSATKNSSTVSCFTNKSTKSDSKICIEPKYITPAYSSNARKISPPHQNFEEKKNASEQKLENPKSKPINISQKSSVASDDKFTLISVGARSSSDKKFNSLLYENSESRQCRALNEKRHSIDCSYGYKAPTLENRRKHSDIFQQSLTKKSCTQNGACVYQEDTRKPRKYKITKNDIVNMTTDGSNYYEQRLKTLEEKIQKHRQDIKTFCGETSKIRTRSVHQSVGVDSTTHGKSIRAKSSAYLPQKKEVSSNQNTTSFLNLKVGKGNPPKNMCKFLTSDHQDFQSHTSGSCEFKRSQIHFPVRTTGLLKQTS